MTTTKADIMRQREEAYNAADKAWRKAIAPADKAWNEAIAEADRLCAERLAEIAAQEEKEEA